MDFINVVQIINVVGFCGLAAFTFYKRDWRYCSASVVLGIGQVLAMIY